MTLRSTMRGEAMGNKRYRLGQMRAAHVRAAWIDPTERIIYEYKPREDVVYRHPLELPPVRPGQPYLRSELRKVSFDEAPEDGWSVWDAAPLFCNPGETTIRSTTGELWHASGDPVATRTGVASPDGRIVLPWPHVEAVVRYLESSEQSYFGSVVLTKHGIEVRSPISVALYPHGLPRESPEELRGEAERCIEEGEQEESWLFPD
jgi:hypothetical protein